MPREIKIPPRQRPADDNGYFEELTKAIFKAGFSWTVIDNKWPNFQQAFAGFDVDQVAAYDVPDVERLLADASIVRNGRKILATITNARTMQALRDEYGSLYGYLRSLDDLPYEGRRNTLTGQFAGLGPTSCFVFLWCVEEEVPDWSER
jgi:DNA-3-methyladenine glycosylase I